MARVKFSGIISDISGSVGGATFQRSNSGSSLRNKPRQIKRYGTYSQNIVKRYMSQLHGSWFVLSDLDKLAWESAVLYYSTRQKHNIEKELSSYQLYIKHGMLMLLSGHQPITTPTLAGTAFNFTDISFLNDAGAFYAHIHADSLDTDNSLLLKVSSVQRSSQAFQPSRCRNLSPLPADDEEFNITNLFMAIFNTIPAVGSKISYSITLFGLTTPNIQGPITGTAIVEAY